MAIEFLVSERIINSDEKEASLRTSIMHVATHYKIFRRNFIQFRINSTSVPGKKMKKIPEGARYVQIQATVHMHNVHYDKSFD